MVIFSETIRARAMKLGSCIHLDEWSSKLPSILSLGLLLQVHCLRCLRWMNGWMICHFMFFLTVFQSYQDNVSMTMTGCVQWNPVYS